MSNSRTSPLGSKFNTDNTLFSSQESLTADSPATSSSASGTPQPPLSRKRSYHAGLFVDDFKKPGDPHPSTTAAGRQRALDRLGLDTPPPKTGRAIVPTRAAFISEGASRRIHAQVKRVPEVQRSLDVLGIDASADRFKIAGWVKQGQPFDILFATPGGQKIRVIQGKEGNEGGDKVWASPPDSAHRPKGLLKRPPSMPEHRVITKLKGAWGDPECLYADDKGPFLFVGFGEGQDYRTSRKSLDELAQSGVTVIAVDLSKSPNARKKIEYQTLKGEEKVIPKGTFFHLDTVFRPLPHGALVFRDGMPKEAMQLLEACYGKQNIIDVSAEEAVNFAANGRLVSKPDGTQVLFYKEGALSDSTLEKIAAVEGGKLRKIEQADCTVHTVIQKSANGKRKEVLRLVPMPTQEAWKGGGSVSCITQFVPTKEGVRVLMMPATDYKPNPEDALNELERELVGGVSPENAWAEFETVKARFAAQGIPVIAMQPVGNTEALYTRDGADTRGETKDGAGFDPLQRSFDPDKDVITVYTSVFASAIRKPEAAELVEAIVDVAFSEEGRTSL